MSDEKARAFMPMTRALLTQWFAPMTADAVKERKPAYFAFGAIFTYFAIVPVICVDMLLTPILLFSLLRGDDDIEF